MAQGKPSRLLKLGLVQMSCEETPAANLERAVALARQAAERGARVICLQELFSSRYFCQSEETRHFDLAEPVPGPTTEVLARLAVSLGVVIVAPVFERRAPGLYHNSAVLIDPAGTIRTHYRKMHIPDDPGYYEKFYFTPGDRGFGACATPFASVGVLICWDQWFPEAARLTALCGAEVIFYPSAIGWFQGEEAQARREQYEAWETIQRAHAIANGVYVAAVNRVGVEGGLEFWGGSFVADPFGRVVARASFTEPEVLVAECDLARVERVRRHWPFFRDRRTDAYGDLVRRFVP